MTTSRTRDELCRWMLDRTEKSGLIDGKIIQSNRCPSCGSDVVEESRLGKLANQIDRIQIEKHSDTCADLARDCGGSPQPHQERDDRREQLANCSVQEIEAMIERNHRCIGQSGFDQEFVRMRMAFLETVLQERRGQK